MNPSTLPKTNIAMEQQQFEDLFPLKNMVIFPIATFFFKLQG